MSDNSPCSFLRLMLHLSQGTAPQVYCAVAPGIETLSGELSDCIDRSCSCSHSVCAEAGHYFENCNAAVPSPTALDDMRAAQAWTVSEQLCGVTDEEREAAFPKDKPEGKKFL